MRPNGRFISIASSSKVPPYSPLKVHSIILINDLPPRHVYFFQDGCHQPFFLNTFFPKVNQIMINIPTIPHQILMRFNKHSLTFWEAILENPILRLGGKKHIGITPHAHRSFIFCKKYQLPFQHHSSILIKIIQVLCTKLKSPPHSFIFCKNTTPSDPKNHLTPYPYL